MTAYGLGAAHALEPGHGKTLVAAYLAGSSGKIRDAILLGILVTIFHTLSVFILGLLGAYFMGLFMRYEGGYFRGLEVISGLVIMGIGAMIFWRRFIKDKSPDQCECHMTHSHHAEIDKPVGNLRDIISLGLASGISPCPIAVAALIASITLGGFGKLPEALFYLLIFSLGLGSVLVAIGIILIVSRNATQALFAGSSKLPLYFSRFSTFLLVGLGLYLVFHGLFGPIESLRDQAFPLQSLAH